MNPQHQIIFISHGGGPLPLLADPRHEQMVECLHTIRSKLFKPSAIILISAHWEAEVATITAHPSPGLMYDYYGFPEESYQIQYPCKGEPELARQIHTAFKKNHVISRMDKARAFDHGMFVPMTILFPEADIPCVQLSLLQTLDAKEHLQLGQILQTLEYDNVLIIGSGFTFHNMRVFHSGLNASTLKKNHDFEHWLMNTCSNHQISEQERFNLLAHWQQAPYALFSHPREEHLLPLHVCYGAAQMCCSEYFPIDIMGVRSSMFVWLNERSG